jgi:predicted phage terminase large subunit-like protein
LLQDNPSLDQVEYLKSLELLDPLTRQRLLAGDWDAVPEGKMFKRSWFEVIEPWQIPPGIKLVRFWDRASTVPRPGTDPDWTVGAQVGQHRGTWYVTDLQRFRGGSAENERRIRATAQNDGRGVTTWMEQEPGSSGKDVIDHYSRYVLRGFAFRSQRPTGKKHERAAPVASAAEMGNVKLVSGRWVSAFLDEAASFPMGAHDDQVDAVSGAFGVLTNRFVTRSFRWKDQ